MNTARRHLVWLVLMASYGAAQSSPATLLDVKVARINNDVQLEFTLSAPVRPTVLVTGDTSRLVMDFPNTRAKPTQQRLDINFNGIKAVRFVLHKADPPVVRVVIDLDCARPYEVSGSGTRLRLTLSPPVAARATQRRTPAPTFSGGLFEIFRHRLSPTPQVARPNRGTLQEETAFPSRGSPGTGSVPSTIRGAPADAPSAATAASFPSVSPNLAPQTGTVGVSSAANPITSGNPSTQKAEHSATSKDDSTSLVSPASPAIQSTALDSPAAALTSPVFANPSSLQSQPSPTTPPGLTDLGTISSTKVMSQETSKKKGPAITAQSNEPSSEESLTTTPTTIVTHEITDQSALASALDPNLKTVFKVKYVVEGAAYLDGGRSSGLTEGMKLEVKESDLPMQQGSTVSASDPRVVAELEVVALTETSAVTDIHTPKRAVKQGDLAYLSSEDAPLIQQRTLSATRKYPMVVTFTEDDPQDEEVRAEVPRPPQPSVNRTRGWIGLDHMGTVSHGSSPLTSSEIGLVLRADITRIGGSYWNLTGYWRGRLTSSSSSTQPTLQDLINRTYHLGLIYDNPNSRWVAGVGRLYLPWAPSLDTIDGGYFGMRLGHSATAGLFAGSTPDPTSWNYNPDQCIAGSFINFQGGSYDHFFYSSTSGLGVSTLKWQINRPFVFFENSASYKRIVSIYDSLQADSPRGNQAVAAPGPGLSRNFLTVRLQVHPRLELDFNHNYFRDIPTFDPTLIGTGLLDKYLFQGFSVGARAEIVKQVFLYGDIGRSNRTGDAKNSWNQMAGISFNHLPWWGLRADAHYSRFNSSFGDGSYKSASVSRDFSDALRLAILAGTQDYSSTLATNNHSHFINGNAEWSLGPHYFVQGGFTVNRGGTLSYDQWMFTFGWRFDSKEKHQ